MPLDRLIYLLREPPEILVRLRDIPDTYVVGGFLRDAYRGKSGKDIDLATLADVEETARLTAKVADGHAFELGAKFHTWRVVSGDHEIDISLVQDGNIVSDINRRDFTVNALALKLSDIGSGFSVENLVCLPSSLTDLESGLIRQISRKNMLEDPIRILRAYRISALTGMRIDNETRITNRNHSESLLESAAERIHEEIAAWFSGARVIGDSVRQCADDKVLWDIFPDLQSCTGCIQNEFHHLDVWEHTLLALEQLDAIVTDLPELISPFAPDIKAALQKPVSGRCNGLGITRLSLLLHDIGKPECRDVRNDGRITFYDHQEAGAVIADRILANIKATNTEIDVIRLLIKQHLLLGFYSDADAPAPRLVHRFIRRLGEYTPLMILHSLADCFATRGPLNEKGPSQHLLAAATILEHHCAEDQIARPRIWLDGREIIHELGLEPGPIIGQIKAELEEATAIGRINSRQEALDFIRTLNSPSADTD